MTLNFKTTQDNQGGAALLGCGTIHISEIGPTLIKLSNYLEFPFDLNDYTLGSTGKKEYSGDIDLILDDKWWGHGPAAFRENLEAVFGKENVARNGMMVHLRFPIEHFNPSKQETLPRTGFVQIDFNFGDTEWEKFYHYSPGDSSSYKGAHRNLAIAAICGAVQLEDVSEINDSFDRPETVTRWKYGSNGLERVTRKSVYNESTARWNKKQIDKVIFGPYKDPAQIARILLPIDGTPSDLHSLETIINAVKRNYTSKEQHSIWKRCAKNFSEWPDGNKFFYPTEINKYFTTDDK
jgi:hypothetical protein